MSKLSEIIAAATTDSVSVPTLLRMTKVLAARIETPPLMDWVDNELTGYAKGATLPNYRGPFSAHVLSEWSGPYGSGGKNVPIAPTALPKELRDAGAFEIEFREPVIEVARLATLETITYLWPTDLIARLNSEMNAGRLSSLQHSMPMHGLVSAYRLVSPTRASSILDNVRTRVLSLALDLEKVLPEAGEPGATLPDQATGMRIVNNFIYGYGNTVAIDSPGAGQITVVAGDLASLLTAAAAVGLPPPEVAELQHAVQEDDADDSEPKGRPGSRVLKFLGKLTVGAAKTAGQEGVKELGKAVGDLVMTFHGLK